MAEFWNEDQISAQLQHPAQRIFLLFKETIVGSENLAAYLPGKPSEAPCGYIWLENRGAIGQASPHPDQAEKTDRSVHTEWSKPVLRGAGLGEWELLRIGVLPEFRGTGLGHRLMQAGLDGLAGTVLLEVAARNHSAIKLYKDFGFLEIHRRKNYYRDSDALIMKLQLGEIQ